MAPAWFQKDKTRKKILLRNWRDVRTTGRTERGNGYRVGETHHNAKLSDDDVELIRQLHEKGMQCSEIAKKFYCARSTISDIANYKQRVGVGMGMNLVFE